MTESERISLCEGDQLYDQFIGTQHFCMPEMIYSPHFHFFKITGFFILKDFPDSDWTFGHCQVFTSVFKNIQLRYS
jgi:hypothetical protein